MYWILLFALLVTLHPAQTEEPPQGWPVEQRCVGEIPQTALPRSQWDFEGVIFSQNSDGVRAIRTDVDTSYFVAFESDKTFARVGAFSPDGRWFAYPIGVTNYNVNSIQADYFGIDAIEVVSTHPSRQTYQISWSYGRIGLEAYMILPHVHWVDNERFLYPGRIMEDDGGWGNAFTGEYMPWSYKIPLDDLFGLSPDTTRAFAPSKEQQRVMDLYNIEKDLLLASFVDDYRRIAWFPDSSGFLMSLVEARRGILTMYDADGKEVDVIANDVFSRASIAPNNEKFIFITELNLYLADMQTRTISDLCLELPSYGENRIVWSPDGAQIAFTYNGKPLLLNVETLEMQLLDYDAGQIIGWYPE